MSTALELIEAMTPLRIYQEASIAIELKSEDITELNRQQMMKGKKSTGDQIGIYSWILYALEKASMNPAAGLMNVDLKYTGSFQGAMSTIINGDEIDIDSMDSKANELETKYGSDIYGLTGDSNRKFVEDSFMPVFSKQIEDKTGLKFN